MHIRHHLQGWGWGVGGGEHLRKIPGRIKIQCLQPVSPDSTLVNNFYFIFVSLSPVFL